MRRIATRIATGAALTLSKPEELRNKAVEKICRKYLDVRY